MREDKNGRMLVKIAPEVYADDWEALQRKAIDEGTTRSIELRKAIKNHVRE